MQRHTSYPASGRLIFTLMLAALCHRSAYAAPERATLPAPAEQAVHDAGGADAKTGVDSRLGAPARSEQLDAQRGGTDTVNNTMKLDGGVHDNVANHVVTGANSIDSGSFANMSGIPTVIQNSGANVLIQNATIINLQFK